MPDSNKKFHEFALKSILFKGRPDWYFCYLKSERIAHVLALLAEHAPAGGGELAGLCDLAFKLPGEIAHLAAGEVDAGAVLADVFELLSRVRAAAARGAVAKETGVILAKEYEQVAERLASGSHPSPFVSGEDFHLS